MFLGNPHFSNSYDTLPSRISASLPIPYGEREHRRPHHGLLQARSTEPMRKHISKRISAFLFDGLLVAAITLWMPGGFGWLIGIGYLLLRDALISGRSIGKYIVGLTVMDAYRNACGILRSMVRNLFLFLPGPVIEFLIMVFSVDGRRLGDRLAQTQVIDTRPQVRGVWFLLLALSLSALLARSYRLELKEWRSWESSLSRREVVDLVDLEKLGLGPRLKQVYEYLGWGADTLPEKAGKGAKNYILHLRDGRKIEVADYWEKGNEIQYRKLGGIVGVDRKHVLMIENTADGTRKRY